MRIQSHAVRVAFLFTDGVGIGRNDPALNPLAERAYLLSRFDDGTGTPLPAGGRWVPVDTTFGVEGRPQSATNQTAILTGQPAARLVGRHVLGYPHAPLRALLGEHSVIKRLAERGLSATFANSYPAAYCDALGLPRRPAQAAHVELPPRAHRRLRPSATTLAFAAGRVPLRTWDDAEAGLGLTHDVTGERARARGFPVPRRTPEEAADVFWRLAEGHAFSMFEHYLADEAGHAQDWALAREALATFDAFARAVVARRPADARVLICSDHGNVEDLSTRSHTRHPVAVLYFGDEGADLTPLATVADVGTTVLRWLDGSAA